MSQEALAAGQGAPQEGGSLPRRIAHPPFAGDEGDAVDATRPVAHVLAVLRIKGLVGEVRAGHKGPGDQGVTALLIARSEEHPVVPRAAQDERREPLRQGTGDQSAQIDLVAPHALRPRHRPRRIQRDGHALGRKAIQERRGVILLREAQVLGGIEQEAEPLARETQVEEIVLIGPPLAAVGAQRVCAMLAAQEHAQRHHGRGKRHGVGHQVRALTLDASPPGYAHRTRVRGHRVSSFRGTFLLAV